jgi:glycosyltransferase involved in cell wall biosynthesis
LRKIAREKQATLVNVNLVSHIESIAPFLLWSGVPFVVHLRMVNCFNVLERFVLFRAKKVICCSKAVQGALTRKRVSDIFTRPNPERISTLYEGRDLSAFLRGHDVSELRKELSIRPDEKVVGIVAAIDPRKRQDLFLKAAGEVKKRYPKAKFLIAGDVYSDDPKLAAYKERVVSLIAEMGLQNDVVLTGYRKDIEKIHSLIDVFVLPSRSEALGGVVIEAMASGTPVIASKVDGMLELVDEGESGYLIGGDDPVAYAEKILRILHDADLQRKLGGNARLKAERLFSISHNKSAMEDALADASL